MAFQIPITDENGWKSDILNTPGYLQVIDCYRQWCGPCKAVVSTFRRIYFDMGDRPLKFYTANADKVPALEKYRTGCEPVFLFFKDGELLHEVKGVKAPELQKHIFENLAAPKA